MRSLGKRWVGAVVVSVFLLAGCGHKVYPVEGVVVWSDGSPAKELAGGFVTLECQDAKIGGQGQIQPDATFRITTFKEGDGAIAGRYWVTVIPPMAPDSEERGKRVYLLDARYFAVETSGIEVTVGPDSQTFPIKVERYKSPSR